MMARRKAVAEAMVNCVVSCGRNSGRSKTENQSPLRVGDCHFLPAVPCPFVWRFGEHQAPPSRRCAAGKHSVVPLENYQSYQKLSSWSRPIVITNKQALLFFGRNSPYKGLDVLLKAFRSVRNREDVELLIVGEGDMSPFAAMLKGLKHIYVTNRFIPEEEVANVFKKASIVVLPYTSATQSGVIPVAAAFKLPVIATRVESLFSPHVAGSGTAGQRLDDVRLVHSRVEINVN